MEVCGLRPTLGSKHLLSKFSANSDLTLPETSADPRHIIARSSRDFMRLLVLSLALSLATLPVIAGHAGSHAEYIGGTRADIPEKNDGSIEMTDKTYFIFSSKHTQVRVPYERINLLEYGQKVDRRYLAAIVINPILMFAKKRDHFLTLGFQDDDGQQQAMVFRVDKNDIRLTLVALEARTGQQVRYQDEEARLSGKG